MILRCFAITRLCSPVGLPAKLFLLICRFPCQTLYLKGLLAKLYFRKGLSLLGKRFKFEKSARQNQPKLFAHLSNLKGLPAKLYC